MSELFKVYLVYRERVVLYLVWAKKESDVMNLIDWEARDKPQPIIIKVEKKEGCVMCHHIADHNFYKELTSRHMNKNPG